MPDKTIHALLVEDDLDDQLIIQKLVKNIHGRELRLAFAESLSHAELLLKKTVFDLIIADLNLPDSRGLETFQALRATAPAVPIIILTGLSDETMAASAVGQGAQDYLMKGEITGNLLQRAAVYAIERNRLRQERETLINDLSAAIASVKVLSGLLPICASCKKIRNDKGYWERVEQYIEDHADVRFTHGFCPDCMKKLYPDFDMKKMGKQRAGKRPR